mmetsp:Transcript_13032/g.20484  ORF Transcript_13032/g.20484 Transcript_13032/m.20484 type:complete len:218 (+) Transcript_13032:58-711(+)|eukprot:CAMPEP_0184295614 /NCGR_PEP_ID=MMETSP1049-20130417/6463_1 /TAXON_ID=77928 /ORGANISM="Proteomonas sulcata, Strain CCMP704" /LENGTH=217 /DNA_ID=CAMNT_0026604239 /DNA_START=61 /DNA_END=714 /DNA_ORIENTATION=+
MHQEEGQPMLRGRAGRVSINAAVLSGFLALSVLVLAAVTFKDEVFGSERTELVAEKPWGVDFDIKFARKQRQWQITNLVLHPPPPEPAAKKKKPMVMTKATFPYYELQDMNKADAEVKKAEDDPDTDPKVKEALAQGMQANGGAMESAIGCSEGSEPSSSIKTACPGIGSGKPQEVKRQWNMGFPPQKGAGAQQSTAFKRRGLTGGDVDRGQTDERR